MACPAMAHSRGPAKRRDSQGGDHPPTFEQGLDSDDAHGEAERATVISRWHPPQPIVLIARLAARLGGPIGTTTVVCGVDEHISVVDDDAQPSSLTLRAT